MIDDEADPRMIKAHHALLQQLGTVLGHGRQPLTKPLLDRLFDVVKAHRAACRIEGVDFPVLVALAVPRLGIVEFKRADLDLPSIKVSIVNFVRAHPAAMMIEVVQAFTTAYPDLKPDDITQGHKSGTEATQRMVDRAKEYISTPGSDPEKPETEG